MDLDRLLAAITTEVLDYPGLHTHATMSDAFARFALPDPGEDGSKRERAARCVDLLDRSMLPDIADRILDNNQLRHQSRFSIQEALWVDDASTPSIPRRIRHSISRRLQIEDLFLDWDKFMELLQRLWILDNQPFASISVMLGLDGGDHSLRGEILQHVGRNLGDWSVEDLFNRVGAFEVSDRRFILFLEGLSDCAILPDESRQRRFVSVVNEELASSGVSLEQSGEDGGYPRFGVMSTISARNRTPKNLIFGSSSKPDIRFRNAVDNDIEIVGNAEDVLVYDRPIGSEGLRWLDLQDWWMASRKSSTVGEAKSTLWRHLKSAIPKNSPPQLNLFEAYYRVLGERAPGLPALLPEVWLHWDPKAARLRGPDALLRFRMDFLLLLPNRQRIVVEVDGQHHYTDSQGRPSPAEYSKNMAADRDLKLAGYEVYRFGASEVDTSERAGRVAAEFFRDLFARHDVSLATSHRAD